MVDNRSVGRSLSNHNVYGAGIIVLMKRPIKRLSDFETLGSATRETIDILLNRFWGFDQKSSAHRRKKSKSVYKFLFSTSETLFCGCSRKWEDAAEKLPVGRKSVFSCWCAPRAYNSLDTWLTIGWPITQWGTRTTWEWGCGGSLTARGERPVTRRTRPLSTCRVSTFIWCF